MGAAIDAVVTRPPGHVIANGSVHDFVYRDGVLALDRFNQTPDDRDLMTAAVQ